MRDRLSEEDRDGGETLGGGRRWGADSGRRVKMGDRLQKENRDGGKT